VQQKAVRLVVEDGLPYRSASWHLWRDHRVFVPFATIQNWVEAAAHCVGAICPPTMPTTFLPPPSKPTLSAAGKKRRRPHRRGIPRPGLGRVQRVPRRR
jgi:hypothetical protein